MYLISQEESQVSRLNYNGYIIQRKKFLKYRGVDGDNWYLNYCSDNPFFEEFYNKNIDKAWNDLDYIDCCVDESYIKEYIKESKKMGIEFRILLCATCKKYPKIRKEDFGPMTQVLGYDFAYSGGSYYSCILNDIISDRIKEFRKIILNKNGLFDTYEEAEKFRKIRNEMINFNRGYTFEQGDFIIYKIVEVTI